MKLSIIVSVFNEKNTILKILDRVEQVNLTHFKFEKEIIIVDDGSTDGTREILKNLEGKYKIIYQQKNQGKGKAILAGLKYASGRYVLFQDADLEYDPEDYKILLKCAIANNAQVVYGSRMLNKKNKSSYVSYYYGNLLLSWFTRLLYGIKITDMYTGYTLIETDLIKSLSLKCQRFEHSPEVTAKITKKGIKIYEVPISYYPRSREEGKKIKWLDGLQALWVLFKYRFFN